MVSYTLVWYKSRMTFCYGKNVIFSDPFLLNELFVSEMTFEIPLRR